MDAARGISHPELVPELVKVTLLALIPAQAGCGVFLGNGDKTIVFYIDPAIGATIHGYLNGQGSPRPLTHDLYSDTLQAFGGRVSRLVIMHMEEDVYYARLIPEAENEIMERKIVELDCRPSDGLAISARCGSPVYVAYELWEQLEDMSALLEQLQSQEDDGPFPPY